MWTLSGCFGGGVSARWGGCGWKWQIYYFGIIYNSSNEEQSEIRPSGELN